MATTSNEHESKDPDKLNELLEDALDDLLLDDEPAATIVEEQEEQGKPNITKSLEKITNLGKEERLPKQKQNIASPPSKPTSSKTPDQPKGGGVVDEDEMNRFFASMTEKLKTELPQMDPDEARARLSESVPQIFDLMQNLLSKELLYPALKDLAPKFEDWLKMNLATLSKDDRRRYKRQLSKIREIIDIFDDESMEDQERFEKNLELMEQMQSLGAPPDELTVPEGMSKCSII